MPNGERCAGVCIGNSRVAVGRTEGLVFVVGHDEPVVVLVPRQIQMAGMTGGVPYYGGRFTPAQAYAASHPSHPPHPASSGSRTGPLPGRPGRGVAAPARHRRAHPGGVRRAAGPGGALTGPVQVLVVGFEGPSFSGEVIAELTRLREQGVVSLVDVLLVERGQDGTFETLEPPPGSDPDLGKIAAEVLGRGGGAVMTKPWARPGRWPTPCRWAGSLPSRSSSTSGPSHSSRRSVARVGARSVKRGCPQATCLTRRRADRVG